MFFKYSRYLFFVFLSAILVACNQDEIATLPLSFPETTQSVWYYSVYDYTGIDSQKVGTAETRIFGKSRFQENDNVLELVRTVRIDSLSLTSVPLQTFTTRMLFKDGYIHLYADSYFDLYDRLLNPLIIDSIAAKEADGPDFQSFNFIVPGWVNWLNIEWDPEFNHTVFENQTVYIDFLYRNERIHGSAKLSMQSRFDSYDRVKVHDTLNVIAYRYLNKGFLDFSLKKDTVDIPEFRTTINMYIWLHENGGLLKRDRKPVEIYIPQVPSRYPILFVPGQFWQVDSTEAVDF